MGAELQEPLQTLITVNSEIIQKNLFKHLTSQFMSRHCFHIQFMCDVQRHYAAEFGGDTTCDPTAVV